MIVRCVESIYIECCPLLSKKVVLWVKHVKVLRYAQDKRTRAVFFSVFGKHVKCSFNPILALWYRTPWRWRCSGGTARYKPSAFSSSPTSTESDVISRWISLSLLFSSRPGVECSCFEKPCVKSQYLMKASNVETSPLPKINKLILLLLRVYITAKYKGSNNYGP